MYFDENKNKSPVQVNKEIAAIVSSLKSHIQKELLFIHTTKVNINVI